MGKKRYIDTIFWRDEYSAGLDPSEKLLFLYLLTNTDTNICGIYQLPLKTISTDTGFDREMLLTILGRFEKDGKVLYRNGWVAVKNFIKHQNEQSPKVQIGINNELKNVPKELREWVGKGIDTLSHSDSDSDLNSDSDYSAIAKDAIAEPTKNFTLEEIWSENYVNTRGRSDLHERVYDTFHYGNLALYKTKFIPRKKDTAFIKELAAILKDRCKDEAEARHLFLTKAQYLREIALTKNVYQNWSFSPGDMLRYWDKLHDGCTGETSKAHTPFRARNVAAEQIGELMAQGKTIDDLFPEFTAGGIKQIEAKG